MQELLQLASTSLNNETPCIDNVTSIHFNIDRRGCGFQHHQFLHILEAATEDVHCHSRQLQGIASISAAIGSNRQCFNAKLSLARGCRLDHACHSIYTPPLLGPFTAMASGLQVQMKICFTLWSSSTRSDVPCSNSRVCLLQNGRLAPWSISRPLRGIVAVTVTDHESDASFLKAETHLNFGSGEAEREAHAKNLRRMRSFADAGPTWGLSSSPRNTLAGNICDQGCPIQYACPKLCS